MILGALLLALAGGHPLADSTMVFEFPDLPPTLSARIEEKKQVSTASLYLPKDYTTDRRFPVLIWLSGGAGGDGRNPGAARNLAQETGFVCMNLPLFKQDLAPMEPGESNKWSRMLITDADNEVIWSAYSVMLARLFRAVPNLDRRHVFVGGFSNGGHTTAVLLNRPQAEITNYATAFFFVEGGDDWTNTAVAGTRPVIVMQGGLYTNQWLQPMFTHATNTGVAAEFVVMENVKHGIDEPAKNRLRAWLRKQLSH